MELSRAILEVVDRQAVDAARGLPQRIRVQFNPTQLTLERRVNYQTVKSIDTRTPLQQFTTSDLQDIKLDLFFDTTANADMTTSPVDVRDLTTPFEQLTLLQPKTHAPPVVRLTWGEGLSFQGVAIHVAQTFLLFAPNGVPVRAQVAVTLREFMTKAERDQGLNQQSPDHTKTYQVKQSDTLPLIAAQEYGSPAAWPWIAAANPDKITNPRRLRPGDVLTLPLLDAWRAAGR